MRCAEYHSGNPGRIRTDPRCPLWGWCSAQRIKIAMIAGGNHTSASCRAAAKRVFTIQRTTPPLRLAKSRLTAVARLHGACGRTSQPLRAASSPIGEPRKPPLKGLAGVAVLDGVQLLNAKLRTAHRAGGVSGGTQNTIMETQGEFVPAPLASPGGVAERSESFKIMIAGGNHTLIQ